MWLKGETKVNQVQKEKSMKTKEYRKNYNNEYQKENIKRFTFKLNKKTDDPELLEIWDQIENK